MEAEKYYHAVLLKKISGCAILASKNSDVALSKLLFELAYSYSDSAEEAIPLELARFYSRDPKMAKNILLDCEKSKRHELIEILRRGLNRLYQNKAEEAAHLRRLLNELESE